MKGQVFTLGAILTAITGCISMFVSKSVLWAPGFAAAFVLNGGAHESNLSWKASLSIAVIVNFIVYSALSWVLIVLVERIRGKKLKPAG